MSKSFLVQFMAAGRRSNMLPELWAGGFDAGNISNSAFCLGRSPLKNLLFTPTIPSSSYFVLLSCCPDAKDNSFTRSRSSSVTSIDRESREAISAFHFCESYPRKNDSLISPCLLVGTTQGSVMMVALSLPPGGDQRLQQPVGISSCGKTLNLVKKQQYWTYFLHLSTAQWPLWSSFLTNWRILAICRIQTSEWLFLA